MKHVLVVDDFASVRLYHASLLRHMGHEVHEAADGLNALEIARKQRVDLILLDLLLPKLSGAELLTRLRAEPGYATVPVIAITSEPQDLGPKHLDGLGVSKVLNKPVRPSALQEAIKEELGSASHD